jgi:D-serine dehydratase
MAPQIPSLLLQEIHEMMLNDSIKGIPGGVKPFPLREITKQGWNVLREDLPLPLMVLKQPALRHNSELMQRYLQRSNLFLAPHGKTHMAPQLFDLQIAGGAWAITAATVSQIQIYRRFGVQRILMANQLFGRQNVRYVVEEINRHPEFEFYCLMDSADGVRYLANMLRELKVYRPIRVLLEAGVPGGRTGFRTLESARDVIGEMRASSDVLAVAGVAGFEGIIGLERTEDATQKVDDLLCFVRSILEELTIQDFSGVDEVVLTAGGSAYFERVAGIFRKANFALPKRIVLRSGCYLTHDSGMYQKSQERRLASGWDNGEFRPALELWSYVQSLPEPELAILTMGKRDCAYDYSLPHPEKSYRRNTGERELSGCRIFALNDQHAYMTFPAGTDLKVGDMIACGISHPCAAFDKWRFIPVVDEAYDVIDAIITFF